MQNLKTWTLDRLAQAIKEGGYKRQLSSKAAPQKRANGQVRNGKQPKQARWA